MSSAEYEIYKEGGLLNNRYQKLEDISKGAYGIVSLAKDITAPKLVAVKYIFKLDDEGAPKKKDYENFSKSVKKMDSDVCEEALHEIEIHEKLGYHKYIINFIDCFNSFIILEYCSRGDLYEAIQADAGPSTTRDIVNVTLQLISAVEYAHSKGIYHRDIKPENILIADDWTLRLSDWGLASESRYCNDFGVGSERYMAPELFDEINLQIYDAAKCDVWSIGICLLNLVFKKSPFSKANENDKSFSYFACNREALFDIFSTMSYDMFAVLRHSLAIDPDNRDLNLMKEELLNVQSLTIDDEIELEREVLAAKPMNIDVKAKNLSKEKFFETQTPNTHIADHFNNFKEQLFNRKDYFTPPNENSQYLQNYSRKIYQPPHQRPSTAKSTVSSVTTPSSHLVPITNKPSRARRSFNSFSNHKTTSGKYVPPNLRSPLQRSTHLSNAVDAVVFEDEDEEPVHVEGLDSPVEDDMFIMEQSDVLNKIDDVDNGTKLGQLVNNINLDDEYSDTSSSIPSLLAPPINLNEPRIPSSKLSNETTISSSKVHKSDTLHRRGSQHSNSSSTNGKSIYVPPHHRQNFQPHLNTTTWDTFNQSYKQKHDNSDNSGPENNRRHWNSRASKGHHHHHHRRRRHSVPALREDVISSSVPVAKSSWFNYPKQSHQGQQIPEHPSQQSHNGNKNGFDDDDYEVVGADVEDVDDDLLDDIDDVDEDGFEKSNLYKNFASRVGKFTELKHERHGQSKPRTVVDLKS